MGTQHSKEAASMRMRRYSLHIGDHEDRTRTLREAVAAAIAAIDELKAILAKY